MNQIKLIAKNFAYILIGSILSTAVFITIFASKVEFTVLLLWENIALSAAASLGTLIFYSQKELSKKRMRLRWVFHYAYINLVVLSTAFISGWIDLVHPVQLIFLFLLITVVYCAVTIAMLKGQEKTAEHMNQRLREIYHDNEEEED